jgi:hypothetical protein
VIGNDGVARLAPGRTLNELPKVGAFRQSLERIFSDQAENFMTAA